MTAPDPHTHVTHTHAPGSDMKAAFFGLVLGVIVLFGILYTIVQLTNAKYAHEKPAATTTK